MEKGAESCRLSAPCFLLFLLPLRCGIRCTGTVFCGFVGLVAPSAATAATPSCGGAGFIALRFIPAFTFGGTVAGSFRLLEPVFQA